MNSRHCTGTPISKSWRTHDRFRPVATNAGVGLSTESEAVAAARAAARDALEKSGSGRADWGLVFITTAHRPHFAEMLAAIQKTLGTDLIAGCSAAGVLTGCEEIEARPGVVVLSVRSDRLRGNTLYASIGDGEPRAAAGDIARQLMGHPAGLLVLLPDPLAVPPDHLLHELGRAAPGFEAIGAAASGDPALRGTFQFYGRNVASRALAGLHLSGDLRRTIGVTQGCQPLGAQARITGGDGNVILEIDGRPALEVLRSRLPPPLADSLERLGGHLFVGLPPDPNQDSIAPGEYLVRHLVGVDETRGALIVAATVRANQPLQFVLRDAQAAWDEVVTGNVYGLPQQLPPESRVIDVGAHIGALTHFALLRGARHVSVWHAGHRHRVHLRGARRSPDRGLLWQRRDRAAARAEPSVHLHRCPGADR